MDPAFAVAPVVVLEHVMLRRDSFDPDNWLKGEPYPIGIAADAVYVEHVCGSILFRVAVHVLESVPPVRPLHTHWDEPFCGGNSGLTGS